MASEIRVDKITSLSGVGTISPSPTGVEIAGITTVATLKVGSGVTLSPDGDIFTTGISTFGGNIQITGADDQDNLVVNGGSTQFAVHQDDSDGEVSLRAQDGSGNNFSKFMTFYTQESGSAAAEKLRITSDSKVGIGTTLPQALLDVNGTATFKEDVSVGSRVRVTGPSTITNNAQTIMAIDNADDNTAGLGGKIGFAAKVNETTRTLAAVGGLKSIAGTGNFSGDLALYTRRNGVANLDERVRITSGGNVGIGVSNPAYKAFISKAKVQMLLQ